MTFSSTPSLTKLKSEDNAPFQISLETYLTGQIKYSYAMNMTFTSDSNDITGFIFLFQQKLTNNYNSCRVFDFTGFRRFHPKQEINFYHDCYTGFTQAKSKIFVAIFRAIPINQEFNYTVYIPTHKQTEAKQFCDWAPIVLLNTEAFSDKLFDLKFSVLKSSHIVDEYSVILESSENRSVKTVSGQQNDGVKMHRVVFRNLPSGVYNLSVVPSSRGIICSTPEVLFSVDFSPPDSSVFPWYIILGVVTAIVVLYLVVWLLFKYYAAKDLHYPEVLMLYSEDCAEHMEVVLKFFEILKQRCSVDVKIDKKHLGSQAPEDWISNSICQSKIIVVVVSKGLFHKTENGNKPKMIENTPWGDLFSPAYRWLIRYFTYTENPLKIFNVVFTHYCDKSLVPESLKCIGKTFCLMKDFNSLLSHIHSLRTRRCFSCFSPVMPGSRYLQFGEGKELQKALDEMVLLENNSPEWFENLLKESNEVCLRTRQAQCSRECSLVLSEEQQAHCSRECRHFLLSAESQL